MGRLAERKEAIALLDRVARQDPAPGLAYIAHRLVFSGTAVYGEWYPHELAHMALDSLTKSWRTPFALDEGLAMWLGGSRGRDFPALMQDLAAALRAKPSITLEALLRAAG